MREVLAKRTLPPRRATAWTSACAMGFSDADRAVEDDRLPASSQAARPDRNIAPGSFASEVEVFEGGLASNLAA